MNIQRAIIGGFEHRWMAYAITGDMTRDITCDINCVSQVIAYVISQVNKQMCITGDSICHFRGGYFDQFTYEWVAARYVSSLVGQTSDVKKLA